MKRLLVPFLGAVIGGAVAVLFGSAAAIREANDRALQAREMANEAMAQAELQRDTIGGQRAEIDRLKGSAPAKRPKNG